MSNSGRTGLNLLIRAVLYTIILTFSAALFVFVFDSCQSLAVHGYMIKMPFKAFIIFVLTFLPFGLQSTTLFLLYYLIRHGSYKIIPVIVFVVINLVLWFLLSPLSVKLKDKMVENNAALFSREALAEGYGEENGTFKNQGSYVYYFSRAGEGDRSPGFVIDLDALEKKGEVFQSGKYSGMVEKMSDTLVEDAIQTPKATDWIIDRFVNLFSLENTLLHLDWAYWLSFASLALVLISLLAFRNFSQWRLMNWVIISILFLAFLIFNYYAWIPDSFMNGFREKINGWLKFIPFVHNQFAIFFNLIFTILLSVTGIIVDVKGRARFAEDN